jgi:hypothetical protein
VRKTAHIEKLPAQIAALDPKIVFVVAIRKGNVLAFYGRNTEVDVNENYLTRLEALWSSIAFETVKIYGKVNYSLIQLEKFSILGLNIRDTTFLIAKHGEVSQDFTSKMKMEIEKMTAHDADYSQMQEVNIIKIPSKHEPEKTMKNIVTRQVHNAAEANRTMKMGPTRELTLRNWDSIFDTALRQRKVAGEKIQETMEKIGKLEAKLDKILSEKSRKIENAN